MLIHVMIKPCEVDVLMAVALQSNDPENLLKATSPLIRMFDDLNEWTVNNGGRVLCKFGEFFALAISADVVDKFSQFIKKYEYTSKTSTAIGIGGTPMEAFYAMEASEAKGGESIVLYSDDLESTMSSESEPILSKAETMYGFDVPNLGLDEPNAAEPNQPQQPQQQPQQDSMKQKVVQALMQVKQTAPMIAQLKDTSPEAYGAIKALVDAILEMAKGTEQPPEAAPQTPPQDKPQSPPQDSPQKPPEAQPKPQQPQA
jgi:hypothetical protein